MIYFIRYILPNLTVLGLFCAGALWLIKKAIESVSNTIPAYLNEKAKNLASKQDIADITREVEKVKDEFTSKTEQLRTDLQYYNQLRFSVKTEERNSIIVCHERLAVWIAMLTSIAFGNFDDDDDNEGIIKHMRSIEAAYFQVLIAQAKMGLYVRDGDFMTIFSNLKIKSLELSNFASTQCVKYSRVLEDYKLRLAILNPDDHEGRGQLIDKNYASRRTIAQAYSSRMLTDYQEIVKLEGIWEEEVMKKITDLTSQVNNK
jgi:hypothetical protein